MIGKTGPGKEETDANMRSQGGAESPLKHEGARSEGSGGDRGEYIHQRLVEQINKASQEGPSQVQAGTGVLEKVQAGLRRSQLKMQICGARVFWSQGPKE